jgi:uncharacterized membrane protein YdjX (TVP38/TMEM64 family)
MSDEHEGSPAASPRRSGGWKRYVPLVVLAALIALVFAMGWHNSLTLDALAENRERLQTFVAEHYALSLLAFFLIYVAAVTLSVPGAVFLTIGGGFLFGVVVALPVVVVAATAGATQVYLIARTALGETLAARAGPRLEKLRQGFQEDAFSYLLFLRLVPAFPFWLVNLAPALLGVRLPTYVAATFIGIIPGSLAYTYVGRGLDSVIETGVILTPQLLIAFALLGLVALIPVVVKKIRGRKA